jgi:hypothetical protein
LELSPERHGVVRAGVLCDPTLFDEAVHGAESAKTIGRVRRRLLEPTLHPLRLYAEHRRKSEASIERHRTICRSKHSRAVVTEHFGLRELGEELGVAGVARGELGEAARRGDRRSPRDPFR